MSLAHTAMAGTENQPFQIRFFDVYGFYGTTPPQAIRSSPAASHHSTGITGPSSESSFEIIPHSPNIAPSLQLTSSNNGSDKSDGDSWVIFNNETSSSTGSAGPSITRPRQTTSLECQLSQEGVWDQLPLVSEGYYVQQQTTYSGRSPVPISAHVNQHQPVSVMQDSTLDTFTISNAICTPHSPLGTWHDLGSGASIGALSEREVLEYLDAIPLGGTETASGTSRNGSIDAQQNCIRALHTINKDDSKWWKNFLLHSNSASNVQQPLLGIPPRVDLTQLNKTSTFPGKSARGTPSTAAGFSTPNTSNFGSEDFTRMTDSIRVHPGTTFGASSTSSNNPHFPPRDFNGASGAGSERRLKRTNEDSLCPIESSTSMASFAADVYVGKYQNINSSALSPARVTKKAKYLPLGMSASSESYNCLNSEFTSQPHVVPSYRTTANPMDDESTHGSTEAEQFSPATGCAEFQRLYDTTHRLDQDILEQDALNPIHEAVREPPDASDWSSLPLDIDLVNSGNLHGSLLISTEFFPETMPPDSPDGDREYFHEDSNNEISSNPVSPSEHGQVTTPSESAGPFYGPQRPPQSHLTAQPVFPYQCQTSNLPLQGISGWPSPYPQMALNWPPQPCIYMPQPDNRISDQEYDAGDEQQRGGTSPTTSKPSDATQRKRKRGAFEDKRRVIVGKVREAGACMRCHFLRESCDLGNPCGNCRKVDGKQKIWGNMPCQRLNITEAQLFRKGNSKFKQESAVLLRVYDQFIPNAEAKRLVLGRPPPIAAKYWGKRLVYPGLRIQCREFNPTPKDLLHETWNEDGKEVQYVIPPFAATDIEDLSDAIKGYVRDTFDLFKHDMVSEEHDPLVRLVFGEAIRYSDQHQCANEGKQGIQETCMLKDALKIWILTRLAYEGYGILEGGDSFGVDVINNPMSPYHETVPISPILDHQLDTVGIRYMITLKDNVLRALKKKIAKRRQSQWYEVFLTIFVLLHNLEYVARRQYLYMKRHENTWAAKGDTNIAFFTTTWMAEWETAANSLIKHFQVALKGAVPFSFNWERSDNGEDGAEGDGAKPKKKGNRKGKKKETIDPVEEARKKAGMDDQAVEFMKAVTSIVQRRKPEFQTLQKESDGRQYDNDMVWVSQLFLDVE